jgi:hypothetical protein
MQKPSLMALLSQECLQNQAIASIVSPKSQKNWPKTICSVSSNRKKKELTSFYAFGEQKRPIAKIKANREPDYPSYEPTGVEFESDRDVLVEIKIPSHCKLLTKNVNFNI